MMDFLRALAPHHGSARHRAVAAVRSRYETDRPMQSVPSIAADADGDERERAPRSTEGSVPLASPVPPAAQSARSPEETHTSISDPALPARPQAEARSAIEIPAPKTLVAEVAHRAVRKFVDEPLRRPAGLAEMSGGPEGPPLPEHLNLQRASRLLSSPSTAAVGAPSARSRDASQQDGPLSRQAVLSRVEQHSERHPIVHVTIDRIDVRAPAAPERTVSRSRPRPSSSTGTLTDYLRTRPGRSGGRS